MQLLLNNFHACKRTLIITYKKRTISPSSLNMDYFITKPTAVPRRTGDKRTYVSIFG